MGRPRPMRFLALLAALAIGAAADVKTNWQDIWRQSRHQCEEGRRAMFTGKNGKLVERKVGDMSRLMAEHMMEQPVSNHAAKTKPAAPSPQKGKLSKKERLKQELMGHVGGNFDGVQREQEEQERKRTLHEYMTQSENVLGQIFKRAKLRPNDALTLSEFCDLMWRGGNASPLDEDDPPQKDDDDADEAEDGEEADSLADKVEL